MGQSRTASRFGSDCPLNAVALGIANHVSVKGDNSLNGQKRMVREDERRPSSHGCKNSE